MTRRARTFPEAVEPAPSDDAPKTIPATLGPGDDDGKDRGVAGAVVGPPGPGDDDGRHRGIAGAVVGPPAPGDADAIDRGEAATVRGPLAPGASDPNDRVNRNVRMLVQPAAGPGETYTPRRITVFPIKKE